MMDDIIDTGVHSVGFVHMVHIGHLRMELEIRGHFIQQPLDYIDGLVQETRKSSAWDFRSVIFKLILSLIADVSLVKLPTCD